MRTRSIYGHKYFTLFTDDFSRMTWVTFLKEELEAFSKFKAFKALVEKETDKNLKCLRSDRGGEFTSNEFVRYCNENGIKRQLSSPRTPQHNGITERKKWTIVEAARTMLMQGDVPKMFWREVVSIVVYTLNRVLVKKCNDKTPYELWYGRTPNVNYLKVFGSRCFIKRDYYTGKFHPKSDEGTFLGYYTKRKDFKCFNKRTKKIVESLNVKVDEYSDESDDTSKSNSANDEQNLVIIELEVQKDVEHNSADEDAQLIEVEEDEEQEDVIAPEQVIPRYVRLNHSEDQIVGN